MPRKSSWCPPATCRRFQVLPVSFETRITPLEPQAHTPIRSSGESPEWPVAIAFDNGAALTPRRLGSIPLVCTDHDTPSAAFTSRASATSSLLGELHRRAPAAAPH